MSTKKGKNKNEKNKKGNIKKIILCIIIPILAILIPFALSFIVSLIFPDKDMYLLSGISLYICVGFYIVIIPIIILKLIIKENNKKIAMKDYFKEHFFKHPKIFSLGIIILVFIECMLGIVENKYFKDIIMNQQEGIMTEATITKEYNTRHSNKYYITGLIDGKTTTLELCGEAMPKRDYNYKKTEKKVKIYYYKNLEEVHKLEYLE